MCRLSMIVMRADFLWDWNVAKGPFVTEVRRRNGTEMEWYGDSAGNTVEENSSIFSLIQMH